MGELVLWTFLVKTLQSSLGRLLLFNCLRFERGPIAQELLKAKLLHVFIMSVFLPSFEGSIHYELGFIYQNVILDISHNKSNHSSNQVSVEQIWSSPI